LKKPNAVRLRPAVITILILAVSSAFPAVSAAQTAANADALDWQGKLRFHGNDTYGPMAIVGIAAYAGALQAAGAPEEWGGGAGAYGKRVASTAGWSGIHTVMAFGLDSTLHQDPRYYRSSGTGFWRRSGHALRETILTHTDRGGETFSTWRVGSAYGSAFLSNMWYPDRLNTVRLGFLQGSVTLGFGFISNLGTEFWPDIKHRVFRK
jgi:hypothetical protein